MIQAVDNYPTISVCTVTLNSGKRLITTLKSILEQDAQGFEIILVDGGSSDGTYQSAIALLQESARMFRVLSEPDRGIYDAFNKSVEMAKGKYILFLNAGDEFVNHAVLSRVQSHIDSNCSQRILYGDVVVRFNDGRPMAHRRSGKLQRLVHEMPFSHQSVFAPRALLLEEPFSLLRICGDHLWFLRRYKEGADFAYLGFEVATVESGGLSDSLRLEVFKERYAFRSLLTKSETIVLLIATIGRTTIEIVKHYPRKAVLSIRPVLRRRGNKTEK